MRKRVKNWIGKVEKVRDARAHAHIRGRECVRKRHEYIDTYTHGKHRKDSAEAYQLVHLLLSQRRRSMAVSWNRWRCKNLCKNTNQQSKYVEMNVYANDYIAIRSVITRMSVCVCVYSDTYWVSPGFLYLITVDFRCEKFLFRNTYETYLPIVDKYIILNKYIYWTVATDDDDDDDVDTLIVIISIILLFIFIYLFSCCPL